MNFRAIFERFLFDRLDPRPSPTCSTACLARTYLNPIFLEVAVLIMAQNANTAPAAFPQLKPSVSQALWGHLRQMNVPVALKDKTGLSSTPTPITPIDKAGTSMRMLLHDTQATLEKFSGHIERLTSKVDDAKREVTTAHKAFQYGHEKMLEESVALREWKCAYTRLWSALYAPWLGQHTCGRTDFSSSEPLSDRDSEVRRKASPILCFG